MLPTEMDKNLHRMRRWGKRGREWKHRLMGKYDQWILFKLNKYGPGGQISYEESIADRKMQIKINRYNKQGRDERAYN